jgi:hypothetical protein
MQPDDGQRIHGRAASPDWPICYRAGCRFCIIERVATEEVVLVHAGSSEPLVIPLAWLDDLTHDPGGLIRPWAARIHAADS